MICNVAMDIDLQWHIHKHSNDGAMAIGPLQGSAR